MIYFFGCGCQGQDRAAFLAVDGTRLANFKIAFGDNPNPIFDEAQVPFQKTYRTLNRNRTSNSPTPPTDHVGDWTRTINVYSKNETGDTIPADIGPYPTDPSGWVTAPTVTYSADGTVRTRVYPCVADTVTEVDTLSSEYTRVQMESDLDALALGIGWATIGGGIVRLRYFQLGTGSAVYDDYVFELAPGLPLVGSHFFYDGLGASRMYYRGSVTTLWRVTENRTPLDPAIYGPDDAYNITCATYTSTQCHPPPEVLIPIPGMGSGAAQYVGVNVFAKMKACGD